MSNMIYKGLMLNYDYILYSWVVSCEKGSIVGKFTTLDKAKEFIDSFKELTI